MRRLTPFVAVVLAASSCTIDDADLKATSAITAIDATASATQLSQRRTEVKGHLTLGYTAQQEVQLRILDNSVEVFSTSMPASTLGIDFDQVVDLVSEGDNVISVEATYNGQSIRKVLGLTVPAAVQNFTIMPAATNVSVFSSDVTVSVQFGYVSPRPATLELQVEGNTVYRTIIDASSVDKLSAMVTTTVPLFREGTNQITAALNYAGQDRTQSIAVLFAWDAPTMQLTWGAQVYTPGGPNVTTLTPGVAVTGNVTITADAAYHIDSVNFAVDNGPSIAAIPDTGMPGKNTLPLTNPDVGTRIVGVTVVTSNDRHTLTTTFFDTGLQVLPVFDCNNPGNSMLPTTDLISNDTTDSRVMLGYFGTPGNHSVSFVVSGYNFNFNFNNNMRYNVEVVGRITAASPSSINVEFNSAPLRACDNGGCNEPYGLQAFFDGTSLCNNTGFGQAVRY
jgi:hypothetical protein